MPGKNVAPGGEPASVGVDCDSCEEFRQGETEADAERDWSRATDCRVLLRRHQDSAECVAREPR
ncbi:MULTISPECIES: hypothetical protein [Streptomyces]|uniref:Uncharacterized protein n=1 Tax=Streptomyces fungicidicus TaxID=68203 RepID=A0ACC7Y7J4_9ACTN|nr:MULTISPECIES: hypothetical protein [Streptomyces]MBF4134980.1 hypothetical protein [Streptomyces albidoflavus]NUV77882.1 hypothetical protein [Streptomyces fungicidicus]PAX85198.1 hypothetical protein CLM81_13885 [Streptomyces albidoflavus]PAX92770.1 hypothetical protein CLM82_01350 [Streptomyces albidoflavus]PBO18081.1 hypothetical protein CLM83_14460 [Streptomyces albidoflavus]